MIDCAIVKHCAWNARFIAESPHPIPRLKSVDADAMIVVSNICPILLNVTPTVDLWKRGREEAERGKES